MTNPKNIDRNASQGELKDYRDNLKNSGNKIRGEEDEIIKDKDDFTEELLKKTESLQAETKSLQAERESLQAERESLHEKLNEVQATIDSMKDNLNSLNYSSNNGTSYTEIQQQTEPETQQQIETETQQQIEPKEEQQTEPETQKQIEPETQQQTDPETQQQIESETQQQIEFESQGYEQPYLKLDSYEGYVKALSQLIYEIEGCKKTAKYRRGLNQSGKQTLKTATEKIEEYKDIVSDKKRMLEHEYKEKNKLNKKNPDKVPLTLSISSLEINELRNRWFAWRKIIEIDIKEGQNGKSSNIAPWPNQSLEQVKKGNNVDKRHIEYDSKLNAALNDAAFLRIIDNNQDRAREFLQAIANNSLSDAQITICQARMVQLAPYFEQYGLTDQVHKCIQTRGGRYTQNVNIYGNIDGETAYKIGGVAGRLNNILIKAFPNAKPDQVSTITNLSLTAGGIYAAYRIGKWFFGKDEKGNRHLGGKIAGLASFIFGPQLLLGKDGFSLVGELLTGKVDFGELTYRASNCLRFMKNSNPEIYEQMAPGILGMNIFPQDYTVEKVRALQQTFPNGYKERHSFTYNRLNKDNSALANEFKNTFNENQYIENERNVFLAKLGITNETDGNVIIFNEAAKLTDKKTSFELWMKYQGKTRNPAFKTEIDNYLQQEGEFNPDELNPNWFNSNTKGKYTEREVDIQFKESLSNRIDTLPIDSDEKNELKSAIQRFYDERTIDSKPIIKDFNLKIENGLLVLTSHSGQETKINIEKRELVGFGNGIRFSNLSELLNIADLSNKILDSQKGKVARDMPPFQYKIERDGICFNDANSLRQDILTRKNTGMDTRVLFTGRGSTASKIDNLYKHPQEYADYLSKRRIDINKSKINLSLYPTIKGLSESGIIFLNEQEVKLAEIRLNKVKEETSTKNGGTQGYRPFSIEGKKLVFSTSDTQNATKLYYPDQFPNDFTGKSQDLSKFPTILNNKDKFLNYMNNKKNGMRGSALN